MQFRISFLLFILFSFFACKTSKMIQQPKVALDPYMTFETPLVDFGKVKVGERPEHVYKFKNTGKEPITVELISGCDCTEFVDLPLGKTFQPNEEGSFKIIFKSETEEERGAIEKTIDILLENTDEKGYQIVKEAKYKLILED